MATTHTSRNLAELATQIRRAVLADCEDPRMREVAATIIRKYGVRTRDDRALARAFQLFSQNHIKFFREFPEINSAPWVTLKWGIGDCDDKSRLIAALCKSFRIPVRLAYLTFSTPRRTVSHVWPEVQLRAAGPWVALESVQPWPMGKSALQMVKRKGFPHRFFATVI